MDDDGPWLYYKLTNEPKGSGELKTKSMIFIIRSCMGVAMVLRKILDQYLSSNQT